MDIPQALQKVQSRHAEILDSVGGLTVVTGDIRYTVPGEIDADLIFPTHFTKEPFVDAMFVAGAGSRLIAGAWPQLSQPYVFAWQTKQVENLLHYTGARVLFALQAPPGTKGKIVWRCQGAAMVGSTVNPIE